MVFLYRSLVHLFIKSSPKPLLAFIFIANSPSVLSMTVKIDLFIWSLTKKFTRVCSFSISVTLQIHEQSLLGYDAKHPGRNIMTYQRKQPLPNLVLYWFLVFIPRRKSKIKSYFYLKMKPFCHVTALSVDGSKHWPTKHQQLLHIFTQTQQTLIRKQNGNSITWKYTGFHIYNSSESYLNILLTWN
jgi:hypothetical protein